MQTLGQLPERLSALVLMLHGGRSRGYGRAHALRLAYQRMLPFASDLRRTGQTGDGAGLGVAVVRYRYRGWNAPDDDALRDAESALAYTEQVHPDTPVVLLGHSMGARAALAAAGHPQVAAVCALAPWLDGSDQVGQLAGRSVLIAHGDRDRMTDAGASYEYALRATRVTDRVCRFEVRGDGHAMLRRASDWSRLVRRFVLGETGITPLDPEITDAMRRPAPAGLRTTLAPR